MPPPAAFCLEAEAERTLEAEFRRPEQQVAASAGQLAQHLEKELARSAELERAAQNAVEELRGSSEKHFI